MQENDNAYIKWVMYLNLITDEVIKAKSLK